VLLSFTGLSSETHANCVLCQIQFDFFLKFRSCWFFDAVLGRTINRS